MFVGVLFLGFQSDDLFTEVVVPPTCSLTICPTTCMCSRFSGEFLLKCSRFSGEEPSAVFPFQRGKLPQITAICG